MIILWIVTMLGCFAGGITLLGVFSQNGAPQQGALAALAVAFAVIPYCFARAMQGATDQSGKLLEEMKTQTKLLASLANDIAAEPSKTDRG